MTAIKVEVDCTAGTTTVVPLTQAELDEQTVDASTAATAAQQTQTWTGNAQTIKANVQTHLGQVETWLAANPGALPNGTQFDYFARMVCGLARLTLALLDTIGQAT